MSEQSAEQALLQLQVNAVNRWFQRDPYIFQVYAAMTPEDRSSVIEKVRNDSIERGFLTADMDKWLAHNVNQMYDAGRLPEINRAQEMLHRHVQAQEDHAIYNAPKAEVEKYLRAQGEENLRQMRQGQPTSCRLDSEEPIFPG